MKGLGIISSSFAVLNNDRYYDRKFIGALKGNKDSRKHRKSFYDALNKKIETGKHRKQFARSSEPSTFIVKHI